MKDIIQYEDFVKLDMRAGTIKECVPVEGSEKLLRSQVDFGELGNRQILSGIAKWYSPDELIDKQFIFVVNLASRKMMGFESEGMILALGAEDADKPVLLVSHEPVEDGSSVN